MILANDQRPTTARYLRALTLSTLEFTVEIYWENSVFIARKAFGEPSDHYSDHRFWAQ
jgi:hypothetical protein